MTPASDIPYDDRTFKPNLDRQLSTTPEGMLAAAAEAPLQAGKQCGVGDLVGQGSVNER